MNNMDYWGKGRCLFEDQCVNYAPISSQSTQCRSMQYRLSDYDVKPQKHYWCCSRQVHEPIELIVIPPCMHRECCPEELTSCTMKACPSYESAGFVGRKETV
ncbi:MAG: hypothetical protein Pg6A_19680 [Termitinemataceae bacterium]|nr:MAG: hypothetical protein Pg6A_19680 [Termitinemataceae bacterium]